MKIALIHRAFESSLGSRRMLNAVSLHWIASYKTLPKLIFGSTE